MPYSTVRIGRKSGKPWMGLNERIQDGAQGPNEASAGFNFRVNKGVLETRPGITHATEIASRPTAYYALFGAAGRVGFPSADQYDVVNGRVRWTWILSFRTPSSMPTKGWLLHRGVTISGTQYEQGVSVDSSGIVTVALVDSAGGDKSFTSGANALSVSTEYVLQVTRYDTEAYLHWGTLAASGDPSEAYGTTDALGELDHAWKADDAAAHPLYFGCEYDLGTTTPSNYMGNTFQMHEATLLQYMMVNNGSVVLDHGWTSFADPLDPRCALHCRFEDASSHFTDLSSHGNDSNAENDITYQQTTNAFIEESALVQGVIEFTNSNDEERVIVLANGAMSVGAFHV